MMDTGFSVKLNLLAEIIALNFKTTFSHMGNYTDLCLAVLKQTALHALSQHV